VLQDIIGMTYSKSTWEESEVVPLLSFLEFQLLDLSSIFRPRGFPPQRRRRPKGGWVSVLVFLLRTTSDIRLLSQ